MTTLERILNALKESGCFIGDIDEAIAELKAKNERIKELEEAMKPKTCEGCKYEAQGRYRVPCDTCARTLHDEYEPNDNA